MHSWHFFFLSSSIRAFVAILLSFIFHSCIRGFSSFFLLFVLHSCIRGYPSFFHSTSFSAFEAFLKITVQPVQFSEIDPYNFLSQWSIVLAYQMQQCCHRIFPHQDLNPIHSLQLLSHPDCAQSP